MKRELFWLIPLSIVFTFFIVYVYFIYNSNDRSDFEKSITRNTELEFSSLDGEQIQIESVLSLSDFTLVYAWASWCPICADDLVYLNEVASSNSGFQVLAVNRKESTYQANRFLNTLNDLSHISFVIDVEDRYYKEIEGYSMPEGILYDKTGTIILHIRGSVRDVDILNLIK